MRSVSFALIALVSASCAVAPPEGDPEDDADVTSEALSSNDFNHDGVRHAEQYIQLNDGTATIYDGDFQPTGAIAKNTKLVDSHGLVLCNACVKMQGIEAQETPKGTLYYMWGDGGNKSGFIHVADLAKRPELDPDANAGNGKACPAIMIGNEKKKYFVRPTPIEGSLRYIGPSTHDSYSLKWYGTPAAPALPDYTYMTWSWVDRVGGGIVRTILQDGETFYPCDVHSITTHSKCNAGETCSSGWVKAIYGFTFQGGHRVYGWTVHSHKFENQPSVMHLELP